MSTANLDSADLKKAPAGGLINEDVMQKIWDISGIPLPFTDRAGSSPVTQEYTEWTQDRLQPPNLANKRIDGSDTTGNDTQVGKRLGNHCQESTKVVRVSTRADNSDTIGTSRTLAYQLTMRLKELKRDVEAISLSMQGSIEDDGDTIAGQAGSVFSFIKTNALVGASGSVPGFDNATKLTGEVVPGTARPLTEKLVRDVAESIYNLGGNPDVFMSTTKVQRLFSEYCFTSSARIATLTSETTQSQTASTAKGAVNVFVTDFDVVLKLIPNRLMQETDTNVASAGIFDFDYIDLSYLWGPRTEPLAKTGLAENRQIGVDWTVKVKNEEAEGAIHAIDTTAPVTNA